MRRSNAVIPLTYSIMRLLYIIVESYCGALFSTFSVRFWYVFGSPHPIISGWETLELNSDGRLDYFCTPSSLNFLHNFLFRNSEKMLLSVTSTSLRHLEAFTFFKNDCPLLNS